MALTLLQNVSGPACLYKDGVCMHFGVQFLCDLNNSKSWVSPKKNRDTKFISTSRPRSSCVYSHHAMIVDNSVGTNALKLYSFLLCHDPHSVNCDNLPSRTPIENVKIEICTKFQDKDKRLWVRSYTVPCRKVHKNMWIELLIYGCTLAQGF